MSPFRSKSQMKAAFSGYLGSKMKRKAHQWADETPNIGSLPEHVKRSVKGSGPFSKEEISQGYRKI
jgi:hypothetical protein